jgi:uncharacterized protein YdeI (YjbR/CyaY-like superfamily)
MSPLPRPSRDEVAVFSSRAEFVAWLEDHHATSDGLWVGYYRKGVGKTSVTYAEAVEVALAFGWVDSLTYRVDDEIHTNRFTPRRRGSNWSAVNVARMQRLIETGEARPAGIAAFEARTPERTGVYSYESAARDLPAPQAAQLRSNAAAWAFWEAQSASYHRAATHWVLSAKREETRQRRLATLIADCAAGRWIKPLAYGRTRDRRP